MNVDSLTPPPEGSFLQVRVCALESNFSQVPGNSHTGGLRATLITQALGCSVPHSPDTVQLLGNHSWAESRPRGHQPA